ncbi:MAG: hypothetical protein HC914_16270 [Chloroflexaceae bacterium]|nr:hypothetical protein [Chloroflexaceae bacterium]
MPEPNLPLEQEESLTRQLENYQRSLRLIQERMSEYALKTDIPIHLVQQERECEANIQRITAALTSQPQHPAPIRSPVSAPAELPEPAGNPFTPGRVVEPARFVGRKREINNILYRLENMLSVSLVGEARIGKSSLLCYLEAKLPMLSATDKRYVPVYISMNTMRTRADFCRTVLGALLRQIPPGVAAEQTLRLLEQKTTPSMADIQTALGWAATGGLRVVLLLDEFKDMLQHGNEFDDAFLGTMRSFATDPALPLALVVATRQKLTEIEGLQAYTLNNVDTQTLDLLHPDDARELLQLPSDHPFSAAEVRVGLDAGRNHPLCGRVACSINRSAVRPGYCIKQMVHCMSMPSAP